MTTRRSRPPLLSSNGNAADSCSLSVTGEKAQPVTYTLTFPFLQTARVKATSLAGKQRILSSIYCL